MGSRSKGPKGRKKRIPDKRQFQEIQKGAPTDGTIGKYGNPFQDDTTNFYTTQKGVVEGEAEQTQEQVESRPAKGKKDKDLIHTLKTIGLIIIILIPVVAATLYVANIDNKVDLVKQSVGELRKSIDRNYDLIKDVMHTAGLLKKKDK
jgi:hypothetical protein